MPAPCTGELNTRIAVEKNEETKDTHGGRVAAWVVFAQKWAKVQHKRGGGGDLTEAGGLSSKARIELTVRHFDGLTNANRGDFRVILNGEAHAIDHVNPWNNGREWLVINCEVQ